MIAERCWPGNKGDPEKIPLGGPRRTEAEHPQPRFGQVGLVEIYVKRTLLKAGLFQFDSSGVLRPDHSLALAAA